MVGLHCTKKAAGRIFSTVPQNSGPTAAGARLPLSDPKQSQSRALCNVTQAVPSPQFVIQAQHTLRDRLRSTVHPRRVPSNVKIEICDAVMGYALVGKGPLGRFASSTCNDEKYSGAQVLRPARRAFAHEIDSSQSACVGGLRKVLHTVSSLGSHSVVIL